MRDYKNIDRLFQENLKDFEVFPPNKSWNHIEKGLIAVPGKKRIPFWVKISSVAALLLLFFSVSVIYLMPESRFTKQFLPAETDNQKAVDSGKTSVKEDAVVITSSQNEKKLTDQKEIESKLGEVNDNLTTTENIAENPIEENIINKEGFENYALEDTKNLPLPNVEKEVSKKDIFNGKLTVATIFAPIYFSSFGNGSGIDSQFKDNPISGSSSYSYGVKFAYQLNNKFSVQSGVNLINLGYKTNDVYLTPGVAVIGFSNLSANPVAAPLAKSEKSKDVGKTAATGENKGSLNQVFGYIEIPVEVKYNVSNGKLGVNLVGGFSTLLLNRDEVFVETNSFSQSLGASNNLRPINFSGNIGIDVDYLIHKNLYINVSPMFKVQTNTFSKNAGSIQPYYLGVYTGLNYKF